MYDKMIEAINSQKQFEEDYRESRKGQHPMLFPIREQSEIELMVSTVRNASVMLNKKQLQEYSKKSYELLREVAKPTFLVTQLLIDHMAELALDPRLTYDLIKDELDYDAISVTNDEFVWTRYIVPVLMKHDVKVFAKDEK